MWYPYFPQGPTERVGRWLDSGDVLFGVELNHFEFELNRCDITLTSRGSLPDFYLAEDGKKIG